MKPAETARRVARDVVKSLQRGQTWEQATARHAVQWDKDVRKRVEAFALATRLCSKQG